jgi:type II secretory pathway pseudopilin PulG
MKRKKRSLTLLEIMIVIFLITLITGAIGYNMKGTLDKGRAFRTVQAIDQLKDLLLICVEEDNKPDEVAKDPAGYLKKYNLAKDSKKLVTDGWGNDFAIKYDHRKSEFSVTSTAYNAYQKKMKQDIKVGGSDDEDET